MTDIFIVRIYYDRTDAGGVVYHSRYLDLCEEARTEFLRNRNLILSELTKNNNLLFVVRKADIRYRKSAKLDDLLSIKTELLNKNDFFLKMNQKVFLQDKEKEILLFEMNIEIVAINANNGKLICIPNFILNKLQ